MKSGSTSMGRIIGIFKIFFDYCIYLCNRKTYAKPLCKIHRQRRQMGGASIMIWGMILPNGLITIKEINGTLNSEKYIDLLHNFAVPYMKLNCAPNFNFIQDNCSSHVSKKSKQFLEAQSFRTIKWPVKSPDINIIENVWKMMSDIVYEGNQPKNKEELREKIHNSVFILNSERNKTLLDFYKSFRQRLTKVLLMRGNLIS